MTEYQLLITAEGMKSENHQWMLQLVGKILIETLTTSCYSEYFSISCTLVTEK